MFSVLVKYVILYTHLFLLNTYMTQHHQFTENIHYSLRKEINELYLASAIKNFGLGLLGIFVPIYVYLYFGESIVLAVMFYAVQFALQIIFLPIAARLLGIFGLKKLMAISHPFLAAYLLFLTFAPEYGMVMVILAIISRVVYFVLFWPAYHIDFAKFVSNKKRGREVGFANIVVSLMRTISPFIGGLGIVMFGFAPVFVLSSFLMIVSSLPLFLSPEIYERYTLNGRKIFAYLFCRHNMRSTVAFFFEGIETMIGLFLFPIFIMITIGSIGTIGWVVSVSLLFATITTYVVGKNIDKNGEGSVMQIGSVMHAVGWLLRILISTPTNYVVYNSIFRLTETSNRLPYMSASYQKAHARRDGIDEFIITREVAVNAGRLFASLLVVAGFSVGISSFAPYFIIAGMSALLLRMVK